MTSEQTTDAGSSVENSFLDIYKEQSLSEIQYTPEYTENWFEPTGSYAGGTVDDTPVQGLEIQVHAHESEREQVISTTLQGLEAYYDHAGNYPHHKIIKEDAFYSNLYTDSWGIVAKIHPSPTEYEGLAGHYAEMRANPREELVEAPNKEQALKILFYLIDAFVQNGDADWPGHNPETNVPVTSVLNGEQEQFNNVQPIGDTRFFERYIPLGANKLYDPGKEEFDFDSPAGETVADLSFNPEYMDINGLEDVITQVSISCVKEALALKNHLIVSEN